MPSALYQPLADDKSEILGCRSPPPSSSWWARSSTTTKLVVVGGAIASSVLLMGAGLNMCLKHDAPLPKHLVARRYRPYGRPSTTTSAAAAATSATSGDYSGDSGDYAAATTVDPVATIASIFSGYGSLPTTTATSAAASTTRAAASSSSSSSSKSAAATSSNKPAVAASPSQPAAASNSAVATAASGTLWQPPVKASWQIILNHVLDVNALSTAVTPNVDVFDIDLFDNPKETFDALKRLGKKSICYFSAGSFEPNRPDSGDFVSGDKGSGLDGWPGEYWLNLNSANVRSIMTKRIELAASKGCDAIDPDNVDAYGNSNGLGMTKEDSIDFIKFLSTTAAAHGLSTGLKNGGDIAESVLDHVHFAVNEQCAQYSECDVFDCMINAGKPVFHIEYPNEVPDLTPAALCAAGSMGSSFSTVLKTLELDGYVQTCSSGVLGDVARTAILS